MKNPEKIKRQAKARRHGKVRSKVFGSAKIPRLNVYRSNEGLFIQLINDEAGVTLASINDKEIKSGKTNHKLGSKLFTHCSDTPVPKVVNIIR